MNLRYAKRAAAVASLLLLAAAGGCGYTTQSLFPTEYKTIAVTTLGRGHEVYRRDWEEHLTEALVKEIANRGAYKIVDRKHADTLLTGKITRISRQMLSRNPDTGIAREEQITIEVAFEWTNQRTGAIIKKVDRLPVSSTHVTPQGGNLPGTPEVGQDFFRGGQGTVDRAARLIVEQLETPWGQP
ncbi:MAG: LptE family protein [Planctomycetota bacterium]|nr:LptE family protein [Planctomycetota bacterium]